MDAGCTPRGVLPAHLADQRSDLGRNDGSSGLAAAHLPGPEQAKPGTMPGNDRFRLDDGERRAPATPEARQTDPQQAVSRGQFQAFCSRSPKHTDLVTQSQVLELEGGARSEDRRQSREECHKSSEHRRNYERCNSHPFRSFEVFERHTREMVCITRQTLVFVGASLCPLGRSTDSVRMSLRILREV